MQHCFEASQATISVNAEPLETYMNLPCLGRTVVSNNSEWTALYHNFQKARCWWRMVEKELTRTVAIVWVRKIFYKTVVQTLLLYGRKSPVAAVAILKVLDIFHHWVARRILGKTDCRTVNEEWEWPPVADSLEIVGIYPIEEYIQRQQATITVHITSRTIYELYTGAEKIPGSS